MKKNILKKALAVLVILAMMIPFMPVLSFAEGEGEGTEPTVQYVDWDQWDDDNDGVHEDGENTAPADIATAKAWLTTHCKDENGVYVLDSALDLAYFMACGKNSASVGAEGFGTAGAPETVKLGANIVWNDATVENGVFTPAEGVTKVYKWSSYADVQGSGNGANKYFFGTFDGDGYTISGLYIKGNSANRNTGFIGQLRDGEVKNVTFSNCYAEAHGGSNQFNISYGTAIVVGRYTMTCTVSNVHLKNCAVDGTNTPLETLEDPTDATCSPTAGLVGLSAYSTAKMTISNCTLDENTIVKGSGNVGAVTADASKGTGTGATLTIENCATYADIETVAGQKANAFYNDGATTTTVTNCVSFGSVKIGDTTTADKVYANGGTTTDMTIAAATNNVMTIEGVMTKAAYKAGENNVFDARIVTSIDLDTVVAEGDMKALGFELVKVADFAANTENATKVQNFNKAYTSIASANYGDIAVTSKGGTIDADYLASLVLTGIPAEGSFTVLVRSFYTTEAGTFYGAYAAITFSNGALAGSTTFA